MMEGRLNLRLQGLLQSLTIRDQNEAYVWGGGAVYPTSATGGLCHFPLKHQALAAVRDGTWAGWTMGLGQSGNASVLFPLLSGLNNSALHSSYLAKPHATPPRG